MQPPINDSKPYRATQDNNLSPQNNARHKFTKAGESVFVAISKDLVTHFNIDENTWVEEIADGTNSIRLVLKTK